MITGEIAGKVASPEYETPFIDAVRELYATEERVHFFAVGAGANPDIFTTASRSEERFLLTTKRYNLPFSPFLVLAQAVSSESRSDSDSTSMSPKYLLYITNVYQDGLMLYL